MRMEQAKEYEELYWQWLCSCPLLTRHEIMALIGHFGGVREIYEAPVSELEYFGRSGKKWVDSLSSYKRTCSLEQNSKLLRDKNIIFCCFRNPIFPERLKRLPDCPYGLFYKGNLPSPEIVSVAVVGTRRCSNYGSRMASYIGCQLAQRHVQVISGMAGGVDGIAQRACLQEGGHSYAVLGCGTDICYPPENFKLYDNLAEHGGILSEFAPSTPPLSENFPIRNRLIAGLADAVVVVEAKKRSGSLITADLALDQGKEVYAVPGRFGDERSLGCNRLIEEGANVLTSVDQLLENIAASSGIILPGQIHTAADVIDAQKKRIDAEEKKLLLNKQIAADEMMSEPEKRIFRAVCSDSKSFDQLMEETCLSMTDLMKGLLSLQMKKYILEVSRNRYIKAGI